MLNTYPLWKYLLILFVIFLGGLYAAPNLYPPDPAVQISGASSATVLDEAMLRRAEATLKDSGIPYKSAELAENGRSLLLRLASQGDQLPARRALQRSMGDDFVVALNLAPTTPPWLSMWGAQPMKLGLDLSGGVHFLLEVDTDAAIAKRLETHAAGIRRVLRENRIRALVNEEPGAISVQFRDAAQRDQAVSAVRAEFPDLVREQVVSDEVLEARWSLSAQQISEIRSYAVNQNLVTLRNRVNELGVAEPLVQRQGRDQIVVQLPGIQDTAEAKRILGKTATLEFRLEARRDAPASEKEAFEFRNTTLEREAFLERTVVITGENVANASSGFDPQTGQSQVNITLDSEGGTLMHRMTRHNINRRLGVLFIERKHRTRYVTSADGGETIERIPYFEREIISLATIRDALGVQFRITGLDNPAEAAELALLLRAGALAAPMDFVEERTIGPSLGQENIQQGVLATQIGTALVALFMILVYRVFGAIAVVALTINIVLILACMSILSATLTLPGIAGIVLGIGMAVDANVLIFSRIREEIRNGMSPQHSIHAGFDRAFVTIVDANITTLLVALILYAVGTGPVRGFAVTLSLGIITSMFSAILCTRAMVNLLFGGRRRVKKLWV